MSAIGTKMKFEEMDELAFGSITASYVAVGDSVEPAVRQFIVSNLTDTTLGFSFDGVTDHFVLLPQSQFVSDITSNSSEQASLLMPVGTVLYVKHRGVSPTQGSVTFSTVYGETSSKTGGSGN